MESEAKRSKRVTKMCCVPQCDNKATGNLSFHKFPDDPKLKKSWEVALRMGKPASEAMRVCGSHFLSIDYFPGAEGKKVKRLKLSVIPSQNLPVRQHDKVLDVEAQNKQEERFQRREKRAAAAVQSLPSRPSHVGENTAHNDDILENGPSNNIAEAEVNEETAFQDVSCQTNFVCDCESKEKTKSLTVVDLLSDKEKLKNFTGIHSFELLEGLVTCVSDLHGANKDRKDMCLRDRIILVFIKLKLNLSFTSLSILELVPLLRTVLETMIPWPGHESIKAEVYS
ncbi:THAP domain-containing protein 1 [Frankliniella fusca]|uniref:THAP domain-containing protein 1 n=1 Tax=Frankliniella fusca TaxID=407009 RepID=A0AAE1HK17_9NEOP|nr:THAP domain-containing protein 1 [Frankliniella fusca]